MSYKCYLVTGLLNDVKNRPFIKIGKTKNSIKSRINELMASRSSGNFVKKETLKEYGHFEFLSYGECSALEEITLDLLNNKNLEHPNFKGLHTESFIYSNPQNIFILMEKLCKRYNLTINKIYLS